MLTLLAPTFWGSHTHPCMLLVLWEAGRALPVRQRRPRTRELAEAAQSRTAPRGLSCDQALLLMLCPKLSSSSLKPPLAHSSPQEAQEIIFMKPTYRRAHSPGHPVDRGTWPPAAPQSLSLVCPWRSRPRLRQSHH